MRNEDESSVFMFGSLLFIYLFFYAAGGSGEKDEDIHLC
jgi:hypothetical protein